jgi:hypothetical protein
MSEGRRIAADQAGSFPKSLEYQLTRE